MTTASCRVTIVSRDTYTYHRLESYLEADLMIVLMAWIASGEVIAFKAQYGGLKYFRDGVEHEHIADLCVDFRNGARIIYVVRPAENLGDLELVVDHIREYSLKSHAHDIKIVTDETIPKPLVHKAEERLRSRSLRNAEHDLQVLRTLEAFGGRAPMFRILESLPEHISWVEGRTAIWSLIDQSAIQHDHPRPTTAIITHLSMIKFS